MYYSFGLVAVQSMISKAISYSGEMPFAYNDEFNELYCDFLSKKSIFERQVIPKDGYLCSLSDLKNISSKFYEEKKRYFSESSDLLKDRLASRYFNEALDVLKEKEYDLYKLILFIIKSILISQLKEYTNGTTDKTIGFSIVDFKDEFNQGDFIELIVHQLTHMLLFIDDYSSPHMLQNNKDIMIETNLKYKLGGNHFPCYLAFHSYMVGVEMLAFRKYIMGFDYNGKYHGSTNRIFKLCNEFKSSLLKNINLFTDHGQLIMKNATNLLDVMSIDYFSSYSENAI